MENVIAASFAFVATHFLLSHPLRAPLVTRLGEKGFAALYSVIALVQVVWIVIAYRAAPETPPLWPVGDALWAAGTVVMLVASVLLMGSLVRNPAFPDPGGKPKPAPDARGVFAITRHPMMWSFALWGVAHILVYPAGANLVVASAMTVLALVGAALQDRKKEALQPDSWPAWERKTSFLPFAAIADGRARFGGFGMHALAGGLIVWLAASWAHIPLAGWAAGVWRWVG